MRSAGRTLKRQLLELGGKGAALVFDDADVEVHDRDDRLGVDVPLGPDLHRPDPGDRAPLRLRPGRRGSGQDGDGPQGRRPARGRHGRRAADHRGAPRPGRGLHRVGPRRGRRDRRRWWPTRAPREGACTSSRRSSPTAGPTCGSCSEEIFGPVIVALPFDDEDEGIAIANGTEFGLYDYVFSKDTGRAMRVSPPHARRQRRDQHGAAQPGDAVRRHEAQRRRARRRVVRPPRVHRAAVRRLARLTRGRSESRRAPWSSGSSTRGTCRRRPTPDAQRQLEHRRLLDEVEVAVTGDRTGFKYSWFTEHHFLEEYSHVSASEVLMGYVAARTEQLHLGSGIFNLTPPVNHPARVAERVAMLDHLSERPVRVRRRARLVEHRVPGLRHPRRRHDARPLRRSAPRGRAHAARGARTPTTATASRCRSASVLPRAVDGAAPAAVARVREPGDVREGRPARHGRAVLHAWVTPKTSRRSIETYKTRDQRVHGTRRRRT